jgi:HEAT repeat protein
VSVEPKTFTLHDLRSQDAILRRRALGCLVRDAEGDTPSPGLLRACVARLADRERAVRRCSADALAGWLEQGPPRVRREVRQRLREALDHRNARVVWQSAHILARVEGPRPRLAAPLLRAFSLDDEDARWAAAQVLTRLAHRHAPLAGRLRKLSRRGSAAERRMALHCLRDIPPCASNGVDIFLHALADPDPMVRSTAAASLGRMGMRTPAVLDGLLATLREDPSILIRRVAAVALGQIAAGRRDVRACLEAALEADDPDLRRAARHALARLSPAPPRERAAPPVPRQSIAAVRTRRKRPARLR